jgi:hypothetical protein
MLMIAKRFAMLVSTLVLCLPAALSAAEPDAKKAPEACPVTCNENCSNLPYLETECWTTKFGPAKADIVIVEDDNPPTSSPNMLRCEDGPFALCFYSGPPDATGLPGNNKLPCVLNADGTSANCTCQYYSSKVNYVLINAILNLNAYWETVGACKPNGAMCANSAGCLKSQENPYCQNEAPVCQYVRNQNAAKPEQSLVPGADTISTFGFAMADRYDMTKQTQCRGKYAGCMTAACKFPAGVTQPADGSLVQCDCPVAEGNYQIGQTGPNIQCDIPDGPNGQQYVWSAARSVDPDHKSN